METTNEEVLKEFERDIALYNKYIDTTKAIIALKDYQRICDEHDITKRNDEVLNYLAERIIANLEDSNLKINYEDMISDLIKKIRLLPDKIRSKYRGIIYDEVLDAKLAEEDFIFYHLDDNRNYNIAIDLVHTKWARKLLASNISVTKRQNMFIDMMSECIGSVNLLKGRGEEAENIKELCSSMENPKFLQKIIKELGVAAIREISSTGINIIYDSIIQDMISNEKVSFSLLQKIYNNELYQENVSESQKEKDLISIIGILPNGKDFEEKANDIMEFDFDINPYVFDAFAKKIVSSWDRLYNPDIVRKEIADKLLRKAKNEEDKKRLLEHYNKFLEETDIKEQRAKLKQERRRQRLVLKASRQELTSLLRNLNEKLQEEVPGKRLLKEIDFKKLS